MKIALAQINVCVGDFENNTSKVIACLASARHQKAEIVLFPELTVSGYPPEDLLLKESFILSNIDCLKVIAEHTRGLCALVGFVDSDGKNIYNACAVIVNGTIKHVYHKVSLPNYGVFDEKRYFTPGNKLLSFKYKDIDCAVSICEDIWNEDFVSRLKLLKADVVLNLSASPFHLGKIKMREDILSKAAIAAKAEIVYCNLIGGQDELVFDGTSKVVDHQGRVVALAESFCEDLLVFDFEKDKKYKPVKVKISRGEEIYGALKLGLLDYVHKNGFRSVAIGISGGIDSAVVAALAVDALGGENVTGILMPSRYSSRATFSDAQQLCKNLKMPYHILNIENIFNAYLNTLAPVFAGTKPNLTEENLQARIRGALLMAYSNKFGALVLNTGNKSEVSCGYCTLYGDMVGGYGILKDLTKDMVYALAEYLNKKMGMVIPRTIITRAPSAELRPNQKDSDSLPPYPVLDPIVRFYVEQDYSLDKIVKKGFDKKIVKKVIDMVDFNEYKRRQAPMGVKITPRAFGKDRRMPVTNKFRDYQPGGLT